MRKLVLTGCLLFQTLLLLAQNPDSLRMDPDQWKVRVGFAVAPVFSTLSLRDVYVTSDSPVPLVGCMPSFTPQSGLGYSFGVSFDYRINKNLVLAIQPNVNFIYQKIEVSRRNEAIEQSVEQISWMEIPLYLQYIRFDKENKPTFALGPTFRIKGADRGGYRRRSVFALDARVGLERTFLHFFFSPELRYSHGINTFLNHIGGQEEIFRGTVLMHNLSLVLNIKS